MTKIVAICLCFIHKRCKFLTSSYKANKRLNENLLLVPFYNLILQCFFMKSSFVKISVSLQFTKYGLIFMLHVLTQNKFRKDVMQIFCILTITSFIFPIKNAKSSGDSLYHEIVCLSLYIN